MLQLPQRAPREVVMTGPMKGVPAAVSGTCQVAVLMVRYQKLARRYETRDQATDDRIWAQMTRIADKVSRLTPRSIDGVMFQIMLASLALDGILNGASADHRKEAERRADRLLYRAMDKLNVYAGEWSDLREWLMPARCDQKPARKTRSR